MHMNYSGHISPPFNTMAAAVTHENRCRSFLGQHNGAVVSKDGCD